MANRDDRSGRPCRCGICPECGSDFMRQYGAKHSGVVHRYYYACQMRDCEFTGVWREVDGNGVKFWETGIACKKPGQKNPGLMVATGSALNV